MYLCVCNALKEKDFRCAARKCDAGAEAVYAMLGAAPQCGCCLDDAEDILVEERDFGQVAAFAA
ncbi:MAG: ferredoxin [Novosphingobium sp.]|nr:ferredoxin [Novosphingobium sp.]